MKTRPLGLTGRTVSQAGLGTWPLAGNRGLRGYGAADPEAAEATILAALDAGVTFFDTAGIYGDGLAEELLGRLLPAERARFTLCTKGGWHPESGFHGDGRRLEAEVDASRERLQTDCIDVYLLHNVPARLIGLPELHRPLLALRDRHRIRHAGVSVVYARDAWLTLDRPEIEVVELPYNLAHPDAAPLLPLLHRAGKGVIVREALVSGMLRERASFAADDFRASLPPEVMAAVKEVKRTLDPYRRPGETWADFALRFVLDRAEVSCVAVGVRRPEQIEILKRAGRIAASALPRSDHPHN